MGAAAQQRIAWAPQKGPQAAFVICPAFDVLYGGARGGGKTDACLGEFAIHANRYGENAIGLFVRKEYPQLEAAISRSKQIYYPLGCEWKEQAKCWIFPSGAKLYFRPLEREDDAEKYQGHQYTRIYAEELTNWATPGGIDKLKATLRSAAGVPVGFRASANPGGPGHLWVKNRYIDPAPGGYKVLYDEGQQSRVFIPAKLRDNHILTDADPGYENRLKTTGSEALVRAWLDGDWDIVEGAYFNEWESAKHVIRPFKIPDHWTKFGAFDWGSARPFSFGWWAVAAEQTTASGVIIPKSAIVRYREYYGASGPNIGLKMTAEDTAKAIMERGPEKLAYAVADPACFQQDGGPSIAERMTKHKLYFRPADNKRVPGWDQIRNRLKGEDGRPMLYVFNTCKDLIRTLPALQHDSHKPEDVDTDAEDHAPDECRYACMSRPWTPAGETPITKKKGWDAVFEDRESQSWKTA